MFPVIVFKGNRAKVSPKYAGGVFNPQARCYVYRTESNRNPMESLQKMAVAIEMRDVMGKEHVRVS